MKRRVVYLTPNAISRMGSYRIMPGTLNRGTVRLGYWYEPEGGWAWMFLHGRWVNWR